MRVVIKIVVALVALYLLLMGVLFAAMLQPPERFAKFMSRVPAPAFRLLPFPRLWAVARQGHLKAGHPAPDFDLETHDHSARVRLSSFRGRKPVVLVFGSYT